MSRGNFDTCFRFTVGEEGHYSANVKDSGNWSSGEIGVGRLIGSCWGISAPTLIAWLGSPAAVTAEVMQKLPLDTAMAIYGVNYWNSLNADYLPSGVDLAVFDFGVNAGVARSAKALQGIVGVTQDGAIGPITLAAVDRFHPDDLIRRLSQAHETWYKSLPQFPEYGRGWINRQNHVLVAALAMAGASQMNSTSPATTDFRFAALVPTSNPQAKKTKTMNYQFRDRFKEWSSYAGMAIAAVATAIPHLVPDHTYWVQAWQAAQMILGGALFFVPQTAGSRGVEREAWTLLKAFADELPPDYGDAVQPALTELAHAMVQAQLPAPKAPVALAPLPNPVVARRIVRPVMAPTASPVPAEVSPNAGQ